MFGALGFVSQMDVGSRTVGIVVSWGLVAKAQILETGLRSFRVRIKDDNEMKSEAIKAALLFPPPACLVDRQARLSTSTAINQINQPSCGIRQAFRPMERLRANAATRVRRREGSSAGGSAWPIGSASSWRSS